MYHSYRWSFFEDLTYYFDIDKHNSFFDINIMVYNNLKSYRPSLSLYMVPYLDLEVVMKI